MTCLLPTPSVRRRVEAALPCQKSDILSRATRQHVLAIQAGDKMRGPFRRYVSFPYCEAATPGHRISRRCPHSLITCPHPANRRRTDEASRPDIADRKSQGGSLRWHRRLSVVLLRGSQSVLRHLGSIPC